jgi:CheY-like chemotaxis protein
VGSPVARILIIDDDEAVREAMQVLLETEGFEVHLAGDGQAGLHALETGAFDLVLVDMIMPGMGGGETIAAIGQRHPALAVIAVSGMLPRAPDRSDGAAFAGIGNVPMLHKPFRPRELLQAVRRSLGVLHENA